MLSKNDAKYIHSLAQKKNRDEYGVFIAEGPKLAEEILNSNYDIEGVYALQSWKAPAGCKHPIVEISESDLNRISCLQTPNSVLVIARQKTFEVPEKVTDELVIALDGIQDPGNMGTIIRTADWFGVSKIVCSPDCVDIYNPKVVQATMGSLFRTKICYTPLENWISKMDTPVFGALLKGKPIKKEKVNSGILLMGNESKGIRPEILPLITHPVTIPRIGKAESLNVAVATGIILSQIC